MLSIAPEYWPDRVLADRANPKHFYNGETYTFEQMTELRRSEHLGDQASLEVRRGAACPLPERDRQARRHLYQEQGPDIAVIIGNDQMEVFRPGTSPHWPSSGEITWRDSATPEFLEKLPPGIARAELDRTPSAYTRYPCCRILAAI